MNRAEDAAIAALRRLMLAGWIGSPIGDPTEPHALVYMRSTGMFLDQVHVRDTDRACATRRTLVGDIPGELIKSIEGTVSDVSEEVLSW